MRCLASQLLATLHPRSRPSKPKISLKMPPPGPQEGPRRAQDSPKWAQDVPKKGRRTSAQTPKIMLEALFGPSWGHLEPSKHSGFYIGFWLVFNFPTHLASSCSQHASSQNQVWLIRGSNLPCWAKLEANMASKLLSSSLQAHKKASKLPLCKLSEGLLPPEIEQKH